MNAGGAAVLDPIDELFEGHLVSELERFGALIQRDNAVPWIAHESELKVGLELFAPPFSSALFRKKQIQARQNPILSSPIARPTRLHLVFDLPEVQMRFPSFAQNGPHARRSRFGHLNKNAFVFVRDHSLTAMGHESDEAMGRPGLEPGTNALKGRCSTD